MTMTTCNQRSSQRLIGCLLAGCLGVGAATADTGTLTVILGGMQSDEGVLTYAMWSGPANWLEQGAVREGSVPIEAGTSTLVMRDLPHGEYAISAYHDQNGNGRLDTGLFRIPKEPIGTSNDAKVRFGPPSYDDARFVLNQPELTITIQVRKLF